MTKTPRPKLPVTQKATHYRVHYLTLERHIAQVYHLQGFNVLHASKATTGLYPEYLIEAGVPANYQSEAKRIRRGGSSSNLALILAMLHDDGDLPTGRCIIDTTPPQPPLEAYKQLLQNTLDPLHPACIALKERHRDDKNFRKQARVIDSSLLNWLKNQSKEPPQEL